MSHVPTSNEWSSSAVQPQPNGDIFASLLSFEIRWRDRQPFLESRGYMLRPRYRPGWVPSWRGTARFPIFFEDSLTLPFREHLVDATRIADGQLVYIKRVQTGDDESQIATMLSSPPLRDDPENHSVPILDTFRDAEDENISYIVMPFLRLVDEPPFALVGEMVDCVDQIMEVSQDPEHSIRAFDCTYKNLMMDAHAMYPQGFHPIRESFFPDGVTTAAPHLRRADVNVKYYYIDYGISVYFPPNADQKLVVGTLGRDQEVPELSDDVPYDPFKVDVFIVGNFFLHTFFGKFTNVDFLLPLIAYMTIADPSQRPTAAQAFAYWQKLRDTVSELHMMWHPRPRDGSLISTAFFDFVSLVNATSYFGRRLTGWV
ncbi:uncharacterized protein LAESUDRAFT_638707 [Laetiporus sulphureus 93-53]|uniref:Protein kinase domain-containing protein n=1 Tax=Laetiporus sulphureus 93-53 TaxID=1314785 RepID=A0A165IJQ8_9APHY|nr:uncharacterized protein LAESUDRAFT_638707 [Laetiporus sulphureus 93-53]KZT13173.1 hypothetical protein LAESUDRAFT_638707 [Laetiporus sulphureus 93-53]